MIARYSRDELTKIWSDSYKLQVMLDVELFACEAQCKLGNIPPSSLDIIRSRAKFDLIRVKEIEDVVKHDVIAFLTNLSENVGEDSRYIHLGMTSSDVLDTSFSIQLLRSSELLITDMQLLLESLKFKAHKTKHLLCIGRTHGVHAEPITLGLKFARFYAEFERATMRLKSVQNEIRICKISGAIGNFSSIDPFVEEYVAEKLDLIPESISTQVIPRDRHAMFFSVLSVIASSIENIATEIRHLQRSEVLEVSEYFSDGQKGSSAMPHKKNPVLSENLTGLARIIRSSIVPILENIVLWHERDISHSSVERVVAPNVCILLDFALHRLKEVIDNLVIHEKNIAKNLNQLDGLLFSQRLLLKLIDSGMSREEAYAVVQGDALRAWNDGSSFYDIVSKNDEIMNRLKDLEGVFNFAEYTKHLDFMFDRVFK